jgi:hypothetical protein
MVPAREIPFEPGQADRLAEAQREKRLTDLICARYPNRAAAIKLQMKSGARVECDFETALAALYRNDATLL